MTKNTISSTTVIVRGSFTLQNTDVDATICFHAQGGVELHEVKVRSNRDYYMSRDSFNIGRRKRRVRIRGCSEIQYCSVKTPIVNYDEKKETVYLSAVATRVDIHCVDTVIIVDCRIGTLSLQNVERVIIDGDTVIARVATCSVRMVSIGEHITSPVHIGKLVVNDALATAISGDANVASGNIDSALTILEGRATLGS